MNNDCHCHTHDGPHWLYMDYLDRKSNLDLLERCVNALIANNNIDAVMAHLAYAQAEQRRLDEKLYNMRAHRLTEVSYQLLGNVASISLDERERQIRSTLLQMESEVAL